MNRRGVLGWISVIVGSYTLDQLSGGKTIMAKGLRRTAFDQSSYDYWTKQYGIVNVKDYGAVGDGIHDDTKAIQAAIKAIAITGGVVFLPAGIYLIKDTITLGNGSSTSASTQNGIVVRGASTYSTTIKWNGVSAGTMAQIAGICQGNSFGELTLDGSGSASMGLEITSGQYAQWGELLIQHCDNCLKLDVLTSVPSGMTANTIGNLFGKVYLIPNAGTANKQTHGLWLDGIGGTSGDSNNNSFPNLHVWAPDAYQTAIRLGYADFNQFGVVNCFTTTPTPTNMYGLHIDGTVSNNFPSNNNFNLLNIGAPVLQNGTPGSNFVEYYDTSDGTASFPTVSGLRGYSQNPGGGNVAVPFGLGTSPGIQAITINTEITTTNATNVLTVSPAVDGLYVVYLYLRVTATTTVTVDAYTGDEGGTQFFAIQAYSGNGTLTQLNAASIGAGSYACVPIPLRYLNGASQKPQLQVTASVASQVYVTGSIVKVA